MFGRTSILLALAACSGGGSDPKDSGSTTPDPVALVANAGEDVAGPVGTPITFDGTGSVGDHLVWDFGDGTTAEGLVVEHTYAEPGNYSAVLQALSDDGGFQTDTLTAVAYNPALGPSKPANQLALDSQGRPWVVVPEAGTVARVVEGALLEVPVCAEPLGLAAWDGRIAVACDGDVLVSIDEDGEGIATVATPAGSHPRRVATAPDGFHATLEGTGEAVTWTGEGTSLGRLPQTPDARGLAAGSTGTWVARFRSIDGEGRIDGPVPVVLDFDPGPDSDTTTRGVPTGLESLVLSPDEGWLYSGGTLGNTARGMYLDGQLPTFETSLRAFVEATDATTGARRWRKQFDDHGVTGPMVLSEHGNWLFVGFPTTRDVLVLDAYTGDIVSSVLDTGLGIRGLQLDGDTLYVYAWLDRQVFAWDVSSLGTPVLRWSRSVVSDEPLEAEVLWGKQIFWDATDTRMAKAGYFACAICHPDGEHDGLTWDFTDRGEGMRNTSSLLGRAGTGMGRLHWSGNFDEIQDFEHDIRGPFGGEGYLPEVAWTGLAGEPLGDPKAGLSPELDALSAYVSSLGTTPLSPHGGDAVGEALFTTAGCATCHPAPLFTDSPDVVRHDVGTLTEASGQRLGGPLDGLDTPTLLGAWQTGPWLHDGSAPTLFDAIRAHDSAAGLTDPEVASLEAYVLGL